jgi:homoserine dehydrogenase
MREIKIGVLGLGVVGSGTVKILQENADELSQRIGARLIVKKIAVRDVKKPRPIKVNPSLLTGDPWEVINDPEIEILAELIGGVEPAHDYVLKAIASGKNIVTANKEMMAKAGHDLMTAAQEAQKDFFLEGSVAGGIPILAAIKESLVANNFQEIQGIVNGTTNYILTKMTNEGANFDDVLKEAQAQGYAETDPTSDVDGFDAQYKIAILASMAFHSRVPLEQVSAEGIRNIRARDITVAAQLGYKIKLLAVARQNEERTAMEIGVHPTLLPLSHPLASVNDVFNAVLVRGHAVGQAMFYGRGAGSLPTGSAVVGDIMSCARNILMGSTGRLGCTCFVDKKVVPASQVESRFYIRLTAYDRPKVLATIAGVLGDHDVSIESVVQSQLPGGEAEIVWVTHPIKEGNLRKALNAIAALDIVRAVSNCIRVEE